MEEEFNVPVVVNVGIPSANAICAFPAMAGAVVLSRAVIEVNFAQV